MEDIVLTREGYKKLEEELEHAIKVKRAEAAERVKTAREFGDLSENAEYDAAKDDQGIVEARIRELEEMLKRAKIIDGEMDEYPEEAFFNVGTIDDVIAKAEKLK